MCYRSGTLFSFNYMKSDLDLYREIASLTGLSESEVYRVFSKMIKIAERDLQLKKEFSIPGIGDLKVVEKQPIRKRVRNFKDKQWYYINIPHRYKLKFKVNNEIKKTHQRAFPSQSVYGASEVF